MILKEVQWQGYPAVEFEFDGTAATLVKPKVKPNGKWAYKTEYFGAFPSLEEELLGRGWHIAYNQNLNRWAEPSDVERKVRFIKLISEEFSLDERCVPIGMSCGGMYAVKLAALCPERIAVLYLDAPVINLLSCPCDMGIGKSGLYEEFYKLTGKTKSEMLSYRDHPYDKREILLSCGLPIVMVAGDIDTVVPYEENGRLIEDYYRKRGGRIAVHIKPGCGHHPHGYSEPSVIADEIEAFYPEQAQKLDTGTPQQR